MQVKLYLFDSLNVVNSKDVGSDAPTLKDVSTILRNYVGQGVGWQICRELGARLSLDPQAIYNAWEAMTAKYENMSEEDAQDLFHNIEPLKD